jgi:serine phosphatase RsbU (regulator of sigma subunit)
VTSSPIEAQVREAQYAATQVMLQADSLDDAAPQILSGVCRSLGWDLGTIWEVDSSGNELTCSHTWHEPTADYEDFIGVSRETTFKRGVGLPGRVLESRSPVWVADAPGDLNFPRAPQAEKYGLHGGFAFPIITGRKLLGVVEFFSREVREPDEDLKAMMATIGTQIGQFMQRRRIERELRESEARLEFLAEASRALSSSLDFGLTLEKVAQLAVPRIADWCAVDLVQEDESVQRVAVAHTDPLKAALAKQLREKYPLDMNADYGVAKVIRTGQPEIYQEIPEELIATLTRDEEHVQLLEALRYQSWMIVPLVARGRILGTVSLVISDSGRRFDEEDLALAQDLADRAALAIDNARLFGERSRTAITLQQSLLPPRLPRIPGIELAARYQAAGETNEVGGDFYDIFRTGSRNWSIVIGDVCGKGPQAAAMTALTRYTLRAAAMERRKPSRILKMLNEAILMEQRDSQFCSAIYMGLKPGPDELVLTLASGGHPLPLILRSSGEVEEAATFGTLLGLYPDPELNDHRLVLGRGDAIFIYTDGLTEARGDGEIFGVDRLKTVLESGQGSGAEEIAALVEKSLLEFQSGELRDDVAYVVVRLPE